MTRSEQVPKVLQAPKCSELLDPMRASCWILAQHEPDELKIAPAIYWIKVLHPQVQRFYPVCQEDPRGISRLEHRAGAIYD